MHPDLRSTFLGLLLVACIAIVVSGVEVIDFTANQTADVDYAVHPLPEGLQQLLFARAFVHGEVSLGDASLKSLRRGGRDTVTRLIALRREMADGVDQGVHTSAELDRLDTLIDAVAAQRFASHSGLFWHTDMASAVNESRATGKPVLSLRMLGKLTEEQSCANSRWFRILVYSDPSVAQTLGNEFVLHWHSVRPVPKVTVDFGDGCEMHTTLGGNSIHYVLDEKQRILSLFPGLCGPSQFSDWLKSSLRIVAESKSWSSEEFPDRLATSYQDRATKSNRTWQSRRASLAQKPAANRPPPTISKALGEFPLMASAFDNGGDVSAWLRLVGDDLAEFDANVILRLRELQPLYRPVPGSLEAFTQENQFAHLDQRDGIRLASAVETANANTELEQRSEQDTAFAAYVVGLRRMVAADGLLNSCWHQPRIFRHMAADSLKDPRSLDVWVHANVFGVPLNDPWCGLLPPQHATGLQRNGLQVLRPTTSEGAPTRPQGAFDARLKALADELFE